MAPLTPVYWQTISPPMHQLLRLLGQASLLRDFYLAGGTALALRLGHRYSIDLDFFSTTNWVERPTRRIIVDMLSALQVQVLEDVDGNLLLRALDVHIGFFGYGHPLLASTDDVEGVAVASITDIGLMKLDALISRGSRKDFYDLYMIMQTIPLPDLLALGRAKYPYARDFELMAVESLVFFENADRDLQPQLLLDLPWAAVRDFFTEQARQLGNQWFGR